jgi:hypothetical protein
MADGLLLWFPTHRAMKLRDGWGTQSFIHPWVGEAGGRLTGNKGPSVPRFERVRVRRMSY